MGQVRRWLERRQATTKTTGPTSERGRADRSRRGACPSQTMRPGLTGVGHTLAESRVGPAKSPKSCARLKLASTLRISSRFSPPQHGTETYRYHRWSSRLKRRSQHVADPSRFPCSTIVMFSLVVTSILALVSFTVGQATVAPFGQCGGQGYTGPTTCTPGCESASSCPSVGGSRLTINLANFRPMYRRGE